MNGLYLGKLTEASCDHFSKNCVALLPQLFVIIVRLHVLLEGSPVVELDVAQWAHVLCILAAGHNGRDHRRLQLPPEGTELSPINIIHRKKERG